VSISSVYASCIFSNFQIKRWHYSENYRRNALMSLAIKAIFIK
jgi:hypothetical protein